MGRRTYNPPLIRIKTSEKNEENRIQATMINIKTCWKKNGESRIQPSMSNITTYGKKMGRVGYHQA